MKPVRLILEGLRSYRSRQEISFEGMDLFAITGRTGSGKSSLLEAIVFALYHASTFDKKNVKSLISDGVEDMIVSLYFEVGGRQWQVTRSVSRNNRQPVHELRSADGLETYDRKTDVDARVERLLGLECDDFLKTVVLPQGAFQALLQSKPAERAPLLKNLLGLDELDRMAETVQARRERLRNVLQLARGRRQALPADPGEVVVGAERMLSQARADEKRFAEALERCRLLAREAQSVADRQQELTRREASVREASLPDPERLAALRPVLDELDREEGRRREELERHEAESRSLEEELRHRRQHGRDREGLDRLRQASRMLSELGPEKMRLEQELAEHEETIAAHRGQLSELEQQAVAAEKTLEANEQAGKEAAARSERARAALEAARLSLARLQSERDRLEALTREQSEKRTRVEELTGQLELLCRESGDRGREHQTAVEQHRALERQNLAAALCEQHEGTSCPVCQQRLPEGWEAPRTADLAASLRRVEELESEARELHGRQQLLAGALDAQRSELAEREGLLERLASEIREAVGQLPATEDRLLETLSGELEAARAAHEELQNSYREQRDRLHGCRALVQERRLGLEERERTRAGCLSRRDPLAARLARSAELLASFFEAPGAEPAEWERRLDVELEALALFEDARTRNAALANELHRKLSELRELRLERVERPRREFENQLRAVRQALGSLGAALEPFPEEPDLDALQQESRGLSAVRQTLGAQLQEQVRELGQQGQQSRARLAEVLQELGQVSLAQLEGRARSTLELRVVRERELDHALAQKQEAERLETVLVPGEKLARSFDFLHDMLGNRRARGGRSSFSQWLLERRQRELLELASRGFGQMTAGQYGFSHDFQVVDRGTGQARKPNTLSGGESFLASLSLALALSEMVGRKGGRLEAFFLDEGFGSLSPESLDRALDALETLAGSGRMIGIISHVPTIAERIEKVWQVVKTPQGSCIEDLQPARRLQVVQEAFDPEKHPLFA
ncbi:MAG: SMC family ATPase [Armatimonadetes bacterium]|nr:SMC family ATPase [Armatimonadota bacterium]